MSKRFLEAISFTNEWVGRVIGYLIFPIVAIVVIDATSRYVFNDPIFFAHELTLFLFGPYVILAGGYALLHDSHVNVDVLYSRLPLRARARTAVATAPLFFFYIALLLWQGGEMAWDSVLAREVNATYWAPPIYPLKLIIPIGAALLLLQGVVRLSQDLRKATAADPEGGEGK